MNLRAHIVVMMNTVFLLRHVRAGAPQKTEALNKSAGLSDEQQRAANMIDRKIAYCENYVKQAEEIVRDANSELDKHLLADRNRREWKQKRNSYNQTIMNNTNEAIKFAREAEWLKNDLENIGSYGTSEFNRFSCHEFEDIDYDSTYYSEVPEDEKRVIVQWASNGEEEREKENAELMSEVDETTKLTFNETMKVCNENIERCERELKEAKVSLQRAYAEQKNVDPKVVAPKDRGNGALAVLNATMHKNKCARELLHWERKREASSNSLAHMNLYNGPTPNTSAPNPIELGGRKHPESATSSVASDQTYFESISMFHERKEREAQAKAEAQARVKAQRASKNCITGNLVGKIALAGKCIVDFLTKLCSRQ